MFNFTLKDAGLLFGMSNSTIDKYQKGILSPDSQTLIKFANAYRVKAIYLIKTYKCTNMKFDSVRIN